MKIRLAPAMVLSLCVLLGAGCDMQKQQDEFAQEASGRPSGYTQTDAGGKVLQDDKNDWRTAPVYLGTIQVSPAFPNPSTNEEVQIQISVLHPNSVRGGLHIRTFPPGGVARTLGTVPDASEPGTYGVAFNSALLPTKGLHRIIIFDSVSEVVSYGDLFVQ